MSGRIEAFLTSRRGEACLAAVSLLVLVLYGFYAFTFLRLTNVAFELQNPSWEIASVYRNCSPEDASCLRTGDRVLSINGVTHEQYSASMIATPIDWTGPLQLEVDRDGARHTITVLSSPLPSDFLIATAAILLFPAVFWIIGTMTVIFVRPRDERWLVLVLFNYVTAMWFAAGFVSQTKVAFSSLVLHALLWLFAPLIIHLHMVLPNEAFPRAKRRLLPLLYLGAAAGIALDVSGRISPQLFLLSVPIGLLVALILVIRRQFLDVSPAVKLAHRLMLFGVIFGTVPLLSLIITFTWEPVQGLPFEINRFAVSLGGLLSIVNWPIAYLFAIYKNDLGTIQVRPNRLFGSYSFLSMYVIAYVAVMFTQLRMLESHPIMISLLVSLTFVGAAPALQRRFQLFVDRTIFNIRYRPEEVLSIFAERLPSAFDRLRLRRLLVGEILPTLMIRESALYLVDGDEMVPVYTQDLPPDLKIGRRQELAPLLLMADRYIPAGRIADPRLSWVRLVIPMNIEDVPIGVWLLGRRDPDDFYPASDLALLRNLANQIATVARAQLEIIENKHLHQQLLHAQKMEAIGRLSAGISHDFNNLLSAIVGYGNLLLERHGDDPLSRKYLSGVLDAGRKAESLTKQLLSFSRRESTDARVVDVGALTRDMEGLLNRLLADDIELVLDVVSRQMVLIDPNRFEQVILNLAVNAGDAMPNGGRLTIESADVLFDESTPPPHADLELGHHVRIRVRDTGTGIDPQIEPHIFEPFFTTKEMGKGTGLGLATTYGIVNQCGGQIVADSMPDRGTTFHLYLPAVAREATSGFPMPAPELPPIAPAPPGRETILVAEDDEMVRTVVCEILRAQDYHVLEAVDGRQALALSESHEGSIDLLLSDVMMPHMKGPELAQRLRSDRPELPVLFMSGYNEPAVFRGVSELEKRAVLQKPFSPDTLLRRVRALLDVAERQESVG